MRAASVPIDDMDRDIDLQRFAALELTSSGLLAQAELASANRNEGRAEAIRQFDGREDLPRPLSTSDLPSKRGTHSGSSRGRRLSSRQGSTNSLTGGGMGGGTSSTERQSRYSFANRPSVVDDDEPLLFQMSEIGGGSRRSLEEGRGGSSVGSGGRRGMGWR
jgi:autophagy-related protein 13